MNSTKVQVSSYELIPFLLESLNNKQKVVLKINGYSMRPFFKHLKTNVTIDYDIEKIKKYDVILFKYQNQFFIHRIIEIKDEYIKCGGDGQMTFEYIDKSDILGKIITFETDGIITDVNNLKYLKKVKRWWRYRFIRRILLKCYQLKK